MRKSFCLISLFLLAMVCGAEAQDEHLKMHFDFSQTDGTYVTDAASGIHATQPGDFTALKALVEECHAFVTSAGGDSPSTFAPTNTHRPPWPHGLHLRSSGAARDRII